MSTPSTRTVMVAPERLTRWLEGFEERHGTPQTSAEGDVLSLLAPDGAEARIRLRWGEAVDPSDPVASLLSAATRTRRLGLIAVRRERHAVGIWEGRLLEAKVGRHYVQGRTKAGGWSQQRYARRRDNQARRAFADAADDTAAIMEPAAGTVERLLLAGDPGGLDAVLSDPRCQRLAAVARQPTTIRLEVRDPSREALVDLVARCSAALVTLNDLA